MSKLKVTPVGANILVKPVSSERKSISGIVLPDTMDKEKPQKGEIVALGSGRMTMDGHFLPFAVKVGDIVVFKKYSPDEIEVDGEAYLIMDEDSILAIIG
jgi:chaperonin GroES